MFLCLFWNKVLINWNDKHEGDESPRTIIKLYYCMIFIINERYLL